MDEAEHLVTLLLESIQRALPVAVVRPETLRKESASVLMVTELALFGLNTDAPFAAKV